MWAVEMRETNLFYYLLFFFPPVSVLFVVLFNSSYVGTMCISKQVQ